MNIFLSPLVPKSFTRFKNLYIQYLLNIKCSTKVIHISVPGDDPDQFTHLFLLMFSQKKQVVLTYSFHRSGNMVVNCSLKCPGVGFGQL